MCFLLKYIEEVFYLECFFYKGIWWVNINREEGFGLFYFGDWRFIGLIKVMSLKFGFFF